MELNNRLEALERLAKLQQSGALTDEEFQREKSRLLPMGQHDTETMRPLEVFIDESDPLFKILSGPAAETIISGGEQIFQVDVKAYVQVNSRQVLDGRSNLVLFKTGKVALSFPDGYIELHKTDGLWSGTWDNNSRPPIRESLGDLVRNELAWSNDTTSIIISAMEKISSMSLNSMGKQISNTSAAERMESNSWKLTNFFLACLGVVVTVVIIGYILYPKLSPSNIEQSSDPSGTDNPSIESLTMMGTAIGTQPTVDLKSDGVSAEDYSASKLTNVGRCHMGECSLYRILSRKTIKEHNGSSLQIVKILGGSTPSDAQNEPNYRKLKWLQEPHEVYVYCSKRLPSVMQNVEGQWQTNVLDFSNVFGYQESSASIYVNICHDLNSYAWANPSFMARYGYKTGGKYSQNMDEPVEINLTNPSEIFSFEN